ncbi:MAG: hypothetical protein J7K45_01400 [Thaumarchaeota archaeon]|nr:hypothetical protein [Nitrososphaerota archaeon]
MDEVIEISRPDLLSLLFEDRFPFPQIRLMVYHEEAKLGVKKDGKLVFMLDGKWMSLEEVESELLKRFK